jgi:hypothetical protein
MPQTIVTPDQDALVTEVYIAAPPERAFQALTDPRQLRVWWDNEACPLSRFLRWMSALAENGDSRPNRARLP